MNLDFALCAYVLKHGNFTELAELGFVDEALNEDGRQAYKKLRKFYLKHGGVPSDDAVQIVTGFPPGLFKLPQEPLSFIIEQLKERQLKNHFKLKQTEIDDAFKKSGHAGHSALKKVVIDADKLWAADKVCATMSELSEDRIELYERAEAAKDGMTGVPLPWETLNEMTGGLQPTDYALLLGKRGLGKSFWVCNCVKTFVEANIPTLVVTMEMPTIDMQRRLTCLAGRFCPEDVRLGKLGRAKARYLEHEREFWSDKDDLLRFAEGRRAQSVADIELLVEEYRPRVVLVDGVYLLDRKTNVRWSTNERLEYVSRGLRFMAKDASSDLTVIGTHQFNRDLAVGSLKVSLDKVRSSDDLTFDATHIWAMAQNAVLREQARMRLITLKIREGKARHIDVQWDIDNTCFDEIEEVQDWDEAKAPAPTTTENLNDEQDLGF